MKHSTRVAVTGLIADEIAWFHRVSWFNGVPMIRSRFVLASLLFSCILTPAGCGGPPSRPVETTVPVSGVVLIGGKPEAGIQVNFTPSGKTKSYGGTAVTDDDGEFQVRNATGKSGLPVGEYTATFSMNSSAGDAPMQSDRPVPFVSFQEKIPPKWSDVQKAGVHNKVKVPEDGVTDLRFKITTN
jgi:uncharacterized protein YcnI